MNAWKRIDRVMQSRGWRQIDLARQSGVPQSAISKWSRGVQEPGRASLRKIARALGVSVDQLEGTAELPPALPVGHLRGKEAALVDAYRNLGTAFRKIVDTLIEHFPSAAPVDEESADYSTVTDGSRKRRSRRASSETPPSS